MAQNSIRNDIRFLLNGTEVSMSGQDVFRPLATYLRENALLPGTKIVCAEGDCGACTVLVARWKETSWGSLETLNSCIAPVYLFDLANIVSVEGLSSAGRMNEVQTALRENHGAQCGYCTPGIVCSLSGLAEKCVREGKALTEKKVRNHLTGNLCRCTGYEPILQSALKINLKTWDSLAAKYQNPQAETEFQAAAQLSVHIQTPSGQLFAPSTWKEALALKSSHPALRVVAGATDLGVLRNKGKFHLDQVLVLNRIREMPSFDEKPSGLWIGFQATLSQFEKFCHSHHFELHRLLRVFASPQIKNQGTLIGNVLNGSPIGDSIPALMVLNAEVHFESLRGLRKVPLTQLYKSYKNLDMQPDELASGIWIPHLEGSWKTKLYKVSVRKDLDISAVTFAAAVRLENNMMTEVRIALGGVGPTVSRLPEIESQLHGQAFTQEAFQIAGRKTRTLIRPLSDLRASEAYRLQVVENLFHKFQTEISQESSSCLSV